MDLREFRRSGHCCRKRRTCARCPALARRYERFMREEDSSDSEAWAGETDDRSTYNLGDGCRRVMPRGAHE